MERTAVVSSNISEIGYDANSMTLEIAFHSGAIYQYFDVPESVHEEFMRASSKGTFLHTNIKNIYRYAQL